MSETRSYPRHVKTDAGDIEFRLCELHRADNLIFLADVANMCHYLIILCQ